MCLFVGPRERYGTGAHARSADGGAHGDQVRGLRQLSYALEDVLRAAEQGIRSFLVADLGLLRAVTAAQARGDLPAEIVWKVSASMSPSNPVTLKMLEDLGGSTVNIPSDVTLAELAEMRAAVGVPLDLYIESADPLGGVVRDNELGDLVTRRRAALREVRAAQRAGGVPERPASGGGGPRERGGEGAPGGGRAGMARPAQPRPYPVEAGRGRARRSGPLKGRSPQIIGLPPVARHWPLLGTTVRSLSKGF